MAAGAMVRYAWGMSASNPSQIRYAEPAGPFRADQIRDGDPYELSNGHPIRCMGASGRHGGSNTAGAKVIGTDPAVEDAAVDTGFSFNEGKNLRAPDIAAGGVSSEPGWVKGVPHLAVEYADRGQDEGELQKKIGEFLEAGTRYVWVVRLVGPLRVEVYEPGKERRVVDGDGELTAPGVLQNPVPVRALVDRAAANEAALRNLLNRKGYRDLEDLRAREQMDAVRNAVLNLCQALNIEVTPPRRREMECMGVKELLALQADLARQRRWPE
jgi:hypothetical protein